MERSDNSKAGPNIWCKMMRLLIIQASAAKKLHEGSLGRQVIRSIPVTQHSLAEASGSGSLSVRGVGSGSSPAAAERLVL